MNAEVTYEAPDMTSEAYISALEEVAQMQNEGQPDFRANVPEGTPLGEEAFGDGGMVRYRKNRSMMRAGAQRLPDRVMLWNKQTGRGSPVPPTIATKRVMQGTKWYPASAFTLRNPHYPLPDPIAEKCWICDQRRAAAGNPPRDFYDIVAYETHMEIKHPRAWQSRQRQESQRERLDDREAMREMIREIVQAVRPDITLGSHEDEDDEIVDAVEHTALESKSNAELRRMCEARGIPTSTLRNKAQLIDALTGG